MDTANYRLNRPTGWLSERTWKKKKNAYPLVFTILGIRSWTRTLQSVSKLRANGLRVTDKGEGETCDNFF